MEKILIIMGNHSPEPSSVANSMEPLIKELTQKYSVDLVTNRKRVGFAKTSKVNGLNIYRVDDYRSMNTNHVNSLYEINSAKSLQFITKFFGLVLKILYYIHYSLIAKEKVVAGWEEERVLDLILELDKKNDYDIVLSVSQPFQGHYIAEKFKDYKGNMLKWIMYEFDPYSFNDQITDGKLKRQRMYEDEQRLFTKADIILLTPELYRYYIDNKLFKSTSKFIELPYATMNKIQINNGKNLLMKENKINCLYTGSLYPKLRSPDKLIEIFSEINNDIELTLMTNYSLSQIKSLSENNYTPNVLPFQERNVALYNVLNANILINIGNTVEHQVPGKIFEYISTGKPIIHFSKIENDPAIKYFERYPSVLIIKEWNFNKEKYVKEIKAFCLNNYNKTYTYEEILSYMGEYSSEVVRSNFVSIVDSLLV